MGATHVFDSCDFQTYIMGLHDEPRPIVSTTETITSDEIRNAIDGFRVRPDDNYIDVDSIYPNFNDSIDALRNTAYGINATRNYTRDVERDKIIEVLKREKNINTKKYMYVEDLVKEIAKIMDVHL